MSIRYPADVATLYRCAHLIGILIDRERQIEKIPSIFALTAPDFPVCSIWAHSRVSPKDDKVSLRFIHDRYRENKKTKINGIINKVRAGEIHYHL